MVVLTLLAFGFLRLCSAFCEKKRANFVQIFIPLQRTNITTMANIRIILDTRRVCKDGSFPVKLYLHHRGQIMISTGVACALKDWDMALCAIRAKTVAQKANNAVLRSMLSKGEALLLNLTVSGELAKMTAKELKARLEDELSIRRGGGGAATTLYHYLEVAKNGKAERTVRLFKWAQDRVTEFCGRDKLVEDIDMRWVVEFREFLGKRYAPNTVAQGLAWVSRALSLAVADGLLTRNPCAGVRKPKAETRKKCLSIEKLRELRDMTFENFDVKFNHNRRINLEYARDMFMLQFYLIGINMVDLMGLKEIVDGRIDYVRHKTGTLYSVKVQPEALEIIERWRGNNSLVWNKCASPASVCSTVTINLKELMPGLTTNWARHTWASMAAELEIPVETISHALGHKIGSPVTAIYIAYNQKKVDDANRRVIDYLNADLFGK